MKSKIGAVALAVAIGLAILAAVGIRAYLREEIQKVRGTQRLIPVVYAARDLKRGVRLSGDMVGIKKVDEQVARDRLPVFPENLEGFLGQPLEMDVRADELLLWTHFKARSARENAAEGLSIGFRHVTIPVDKVTGCAGRLLPGTVVDVLVTLKLRKDPNAPVEPVTRVALTAVEVASVDLYSERATSFYSSKQRRDVASYTTVTLKVLPRQALLLAYLAELGKMHLVVRSPDDPTGRKDPYDPEMRVTLDKLDDFIRKAAEEKPGVETAPPRE